LTMIVITVRDTGTRTDDIDVQIYILLLITHRITRKNSYQTCQVAKNTASLALWQIAV